MIKLENELKTVNIDGKTFVELYGYSELERHLKSSGISDWECWVEDTLSGGRLVPGMYTMSISEVITNLKDQFPTLRKFRYNVKDPNRIYAHQRGENRHIGHTKDPNPPKTLMHHIIIHPKGEEY